MVCGRMVPVAPRPAMNPSSQTRFGLGWARFFHESLLRKEIPQERQLTECTKIARFSVAAAAMFTAPLRIARVFEAPRCAISSAKKMANEPRFLLRRKWAKMVLIAEFPAIPSSATKSLANGDARFWCTQATEWRGCGYSVNRRTLHIVFFCAHLLPKTQLLLLDNLSKVLTLIWRKHFSALYHGLPAAIGRVGKDSKRASEQRSMACLLTLFEYFRERANRASEIVL